MRTVICAVVIGILILAGRPNAQQDQEVHVLPVQGNVHMLVGAGGNVTVSVGDDGVLLVDSGLAQMSDKVVAAIRTLSTKPVRYVINTHVHPDHSGGNANVAEKNNELTLFNFNQRGAAEGADTQIIAHETVFNRMSRPPDGEAASPSAAWPTQNYIDKKNAFFNEEAIQIYHQPNAHTDGDSIVFFRKSDVISTGDIFVTTSYPVIDTQRGGHVNGIIAGLNRIIEIAVPKNIQEGGTQVIPGHGRLCEESDVVEYRDMVTIIRDRIQDAVKNGMTLDQVKVARLTRDYDRRYGATTGFWTTDKFVEAVYRNLSQDR
jgi:glyoxylase-like metal-dependent hydrolase (beta-lactamase superfamily II)